MSFVSRPAPGMTERLAFFWIAACLMCVAAGAGAGEVLAVLLPSSPWPVTVDGDPREALLFGGLPLQAFDATTGNRDGSVRGFMLATPEGLYAAMLSTLQPPSEGLKSLQWKAPQDALLGDWMALRVVASAPRLFVLTPYGGATVLDEMGLPADTAGSAWAGMDRRFGHTWAGEWLIPWEFLGLKPGGKFRAALIRGKKIEAGWSLLESLSTTAQGISACRFGGPPPVFRVPPQTAPSSREARALEPFDARPFIPEKAGAETCKDAVPAGETATAWIEVAPGSRQWRIVAEGAPAPAEFFRVDFWWQSGTRDEQDALFPARVAMGAGDILVAERLFSLEGGRFETGAEPIRVYARIKIPKAVPPGLLKMKLKLEAEGSPLEAIPWEITVAPPLPASSALAGIYYLEREKKLWPRDLEDIASHGFNAATCPADDQEGWELFQSLAAKAGLRGDFALHPLGLKPLSKSAWGYAADEPASTEAVGLMVRRAKLLRENGFRPWAALCWPSSLAEAGALDAAAGTPGFWQCAPESKEPKERWIYFQGLRENPFYNRLLAGQASRGPGINGLWIFCYAPEKPAGDDWSDKLFRYDACKAPNGEDGRLDTIQWEAQREGILDGRLAQAVGASADSRFPALAPAREGRYWEVPGGFSFGVYRQQLVAAWDRARLP